MITANLSIVKGGTWAVTKKLKIFAFLSFISVFSQSLASVDRGLELIKARYPNAEIVKKLATLANHLIPQIVGQKEIIEVLVQRLTDYFVNASRSSLGFPPPALHLIGLPGIGKTELIKKTIQYLGLENSFFHIDAQEYISGKENLSSFIDSLVEKKGPKILFIDEIDKLSEVKEGIFNDGDIGRGKVESSNFIGFLNQLLNRSFPSLSEFFHKLCLYFLSGMMEFVISSRDDGLRIEF